jgi:hypothetical protein
MASFRDIIIIPLDEVCLEINVERDRDCRPPQPTLEVEKAWL